ncbi:MAG: hypothetical protein AAGH15_05190 [Myxococcota bacterium]
MSWSPDYRSEPSRVLGPADHRRNPLVEAMRHVVRVDPAMELDHLFERIGQLSRRLPGEASAHARQAMVELERARRALRGGDGDG